MATQRLWLLNLDAEDELADPSAYQPSAVMQARMPLLQQQLSALLREGDGFYQAGLRCEGGVEGIAWSPTPRAVGVLREAGARVQTPPSLEVLQRANDRFFPFEWSSDEIGASYLRDYHAVVEAVSRGLGSGPLLLKRAFSFTGRGQLRLLAPPTQAQLAWIEKALRGGHGLVVEPLLAREQDFAIHGYLQPSGGLHLGVSLAQDCDAKGSWIRSYALPATGPAVLAAEEQAALSAAARLAGEHLLRVGYHGPFGIDAFRYRDNRGRLRFRALSEINARFSMGFALSGLLPLLPG